MNFGQIEIQSIESDLLVFKQVWMILDADVMLIWGKGGAGREEKGGGGDGVLLVGETTDMDRPESAI